MTPAQRRFIDHAIVEAAANGFAFELREPRNEGEGAQLTIKGKSGAYDTFGISPDGLAGVVSMSQSFDRDLSKFTKKLTAAGKKLRSTKAPTTTTTTVRGLRDGQHTAGTGFLVRKIKELGAKVTVAATGRVTVIDKDGGRHVYVLVLDNTVNDSPLTRALADLVAA